MFRFGGPGFTGSDPGDRKSTRLNSSHANISYAVFCLKKKKPHHSTLFFTQFYIPPHPSPFPFYHFCHFLSFLFSSFISTLSTTASCPFFSSLFRSFPP